jgi:hypothetical protein
LKLIYLAVLGVLPLLFSNVAMADSGQQQLSLTMTGGIASVGGQTYIMSQHGSATFALVQGQPLDKGSAQLVYSLTVNVHGSSVSGQAQVQLSGTSAGKRVQLDGKIAINGMIPVEPFSDGSAIPSAFTGVLTGSLSVGGSASSVSLPVSLESPFINPFGGPVVVASADGSSLVLVSSYQEARIIYSNVQTFTVSLSGTVGTTPVTAGTATLTTWAVEDLHAGTETEVGSIAFVGMTPASLDSQGFYFGSSIIPSQSNCATTYGFSPCTIDCTYALNLLLGVPSLGGADLGGITSGLCTLTGFISTGHFFASGQGVSISGGYKTVWDIPAVSFGVGLPPPLGGSTITGTVTTHGGGH